MEVTKKRKLQVGDIVMARLPRKRSSIIGIITAIKGKRYDVCRVKLDKSGTFYEKVAESSLYQLENLTLFPNRAHWVKIKKDLERELDADILRDWLGSL